MIATTLELIEDGRTTRVALSPLTVFVDDGDGSARTLLRQVFGGPATMTDEVTGEVAVSDARLLDAAGAPMSSGGASLSTSPATIRRRRASSRRPRCNL